jgi:hypothetical protein
MEVQSLKDSYENQIHLIREEYELLKSETETSHNRLENFEKTNSFRHITTSSPDDDNMLPSLNKVSHSQPLSIDTSDANNCVMSYDQLRNIPRGEGEGSESVVSAYTPRQDNYNVTFEQLLSSSFDSISKDIDDSHDKTIRESLQNELVRCQQQIAHLTSLLRYANVFFFDESDELE